MLLYKFGRTAVEITEQDLVDFTVAINNGAVVADCRHGRFVVRIVDEMTAAQLVKQEGGLPC